MLLASIVVVAMAPAMAWADDVAAERARLADQRIQAEEERRAREEEQRLEQAQAQSKSEDRGETTLEMSESSKPPRDTGSEPVTRNAQGRVSGTPVNRIEMSRALEQLRELGALRDAGYVTQDEFEQLKKKILDGAL